MRKTYVRETSPYMQAFLVDLARDFYRYMANGDWRRALLSLQMLYDSLPEEVRSRVDASIEAEAGVPGGFPELQRLVETDCRQVLSQYGRRTSEKLGECRERAGELLRAAYSLLMAKAYEFNIFFNIKSVEIGTGAEL